MIKIQKDPSETIDSIHKLLLDTFPNAEIKKPLLSPKMIFVPYDNFTFMLRDRKKFLIADFMLPKGQQRSGAIIFGALGLIIWKAIFQKRRKQQFEDFKAKVDHAINNVGTIGSIGQQLV